MPGYRKQQFSLERRLNIITNARNKLIHDEKPKIYDVEVYRKCLELYLTKEQAAYEKHIMNNLRKEQGLTPFWC